MFRIFVLFSVLYFCLPFNLERDKINQHLGLNVNSELRSKRSNEYNDDTLNEVHCKDGDTQCEGKPGTKCVIESKEKKCICPDEKERFDKDLNKCVVHCEDGDTQCEGKPGTKCVIDSTVKKCICPGEKETFDKDLNKCVVHCEDGDTQCEGKPGTKCVIDSNDKKCICPGEKETFDKDLNKCVVLCEDSDTHCEGEPGTKCVTISNYKKCICPGEKETFDKNLKKCVAPCEDSDDFCNQKPGTQCVMDSGNNKDCVCSDEKQTFDQFVKKCIVPCEMEFKNKCLKEGGKFCENLNEEDYCICEDNRKEFNKPLEKCIVRNQCNDKSCNKKVSQCIPIEDNLATQCNCTKKNQYYDYLKETCKDVDECIGIVCEVFEKCNKGKCVCIDGFEEKNKKCVLKEEVCKEKCKENAICDVKPDSSGSPLYTCGCKKYYYRDVENKECIASSNENFCEMGKISCDYKCDIDNNTVNCDCLENYELHENGKTCVSKKEYNQTCKNGMWNGEECICKLGYVRENDICVHLCDSSNINAICPMGCASWNEKEFKCNCTGKYAYSKDTGTCIEKNLCDEGEKGDIECSNKNAICETSSDGKGYNCNCPKNLRELDEKCSNDCNDDENKICIEEAKECEYNPITQKGECICPISMSLKNNECIFAEHAYYMNIFLQNPVSTHKRFYAFKSDGSESNNLNTSYSLIKDKLTKSMSLLYGSSFESVQILECKNKGINLACDIILMFKDEFEGIDRISKGDSCYPIDDKNCFFHPDLIVSQTDLAKAKITKLNSCDEQIRHHFCPLVSNNCKNTNPGYSCECSSGFKLIKTLYIQNNEKNPMQICEDIDECKDETTCGKHSNCVNKPGNFSCFCKNGYTENEKAKEFSCEDICEIEKPCKNGKCTRLDSIEQYQCQCDVGFTGLKCDVKDKVLNKAKTNMIIIGAVLGSVLFIAIVVIIVLSSKVKRKSGNRDGFDTQMDDYERRFGDNRPINDKMYKGRKQGYDNPGM